MVWLNYITWTSQSFFFNDVFEINGLIFYTFPPAISLKIWLSVWFPHTILICCRNLHFLVTPFSDYTLTHVIKLYATEQNIVYCFSSSTHILRRDRSCCFWARDCYHISLVWSVELRHSLYVECSQDLILYCETAFIELHLYLTIQADPSASVHQDPTFYDRIQNLFL